MKKQWLLLTVAGLLAGCSMYSVDESEADQNTEETSENGEENQSESNDLSFVLQESDRLAQVSPLNDDALGILSEHVSESDPDQVAPAGELSLDYSGVYMSGEDALYGVYLLTNRMAVDLFNLQFHVDHQNANGETILEEYPLYLGEEMFGVLEQNTAMPVYIEMPLEQSDLMDGQQFGDGEIAIRNLNFDTEEDPIDLLEDEDVAEEDYESGQAEEEESSVPEGYNLGYNPALMLAMEQEEALIADIEAGNVPELAIHTPPVLYNHVQGNEIMSMVQSEELVNPASGFSREGELTLFWTGISTGEHESTIFLLANRTGQSVSDLDLTVNFATSDDQVILDEATVTLSSGEYGTIENNTLTPVVVDIPAQSRSNFARLLDSQAGVSPQYEIVDTNNQ